MSRDSLRHRQAKRDAAMARPELRQSFFYTKTESSLPDEARLCTGWAEDEHGVYRLPFPVVLSSGVWLNADRHNALEVKIVGWNYRSPTPEKQP